jgi:hypothetical protein
VTPCSPAKPHQRSSNTSANLYRTARRYMPDDSTPSILCFCVLSNREPGQLSQYNNYVDRGIRVRFPTASTPATEYIQPRIQSEPGEGGFFHEVKSPEREVNHAPPNSAQTELHFYSSIRLHGVVRN